MSFAPYRAVLKASRDGYLGDLNATPWVFMLGNCCGWIGYSFMAQNVYVFLPVAPGLILAIWLNIQAIKLQYENHRSNEMLDAIISGLEDHSKNLFRKREVTSIIENIITDESLPLDIIDPSTTAPVPTADEENSTMTGNTLYSTSPVGVNIEREEDKGMTVNDAAEMIVDYASFVWDITAQKSPAPASHELMVVAICTVWLFLFSIAALGQSFLDESTRILMIGIAVNVNLIFFYCAPLSHIATVLETKSSRSIHEPTMITSLINGSLWFFYGVAVNDFFVAVPNGIGALLGVIQLVLCLLYPRHHHPTKHVDSEGLALSVSSQSLDLPVESTPLI